MERLAGFGPGVDLITTLFASRCDVLLRGCCIGGPRSATHRVPSYHEPGDGGDGGKPEPLDRVPPVLVRVGRRQRPLAYKAITFGWPAGRGLLQNDRKQF